MNIETVYIITSLTAETTSAAELNTILRGHWTIENRLHWVRGVTFNEDKSMVRTGNAPDSGPRYETWRLVSTGSQE